MMSLCRIVLINLGLTNGLALGNPASESPWFHQGRSEIPDGERDRRIAPKSGHQPGWVPMIIPWDSGR